MVKSSHLLAVAALVLAAFVGVVALVLTHGNASSGGTKTTVVSVANPEQDASDAEANVRAAVPAIEAYNADHNRGYVGVTLTKLQSYDAGVQDISIRRASVDGYCIESTVGSATYHKAGPAGDIVSGPCP